VIVHISVTSVTSISSSNSSTPISVRSSNPISSCYDHTSSTSSIKYYVD
jgi:hypothetical protein